MDSEGATTPIRVALAASHPGVRAAIRQVLAQELGFALVAVAADHRGAMRSLMQHRPDVLVVALAGALRDGGAAIRELCALAPTTALIVTATAASESYTSVATAAGAAAFVPLDDASDQLAQVIGRVAGRHS